jgi:hemerythrin
MSIQWRDEMAIDQGVIDQDHRALISIINAFCEARVDRDELPRLERIIAKLEHYAAAHFGREEALQRIVQYAYLDAHHHEHADLIRQLETVRRDLLRLHGGGALPQTSETPSSSDVEPTHEEIVRAHAEVAELLHHWLVDHIIKSDLRMKPYTAKMATHARALSPLSASVAWV